MAAISSIEKAIKKRVSESNISCTSMVVTVFGDVVSQHGGWIWLGSLISTLQRMGYDDRSVRTAVYRLVQSDWLQVEKIGRRSYYCFTDKAIGHYEKAARRIYAARQPKWDGSWTLVAPAFVAEDKKDELRKSLLWQGFNTLVTGMYAHPSSDRTSLDETLNEQGLNGDVVVMSAKTEDKHSLEAIKQLVQNRWNLDELENFYSDFLGYYQRKSQPFIKRQAAGQKPSTMDCFLMRVLLVHEYRRILLRDPDFPGAMLPKGWVGQEAHKRVKQLYKRLAKPSMAFIQAELDNAQGHLPAAQPSFYQRFDGLP